MELRSDRRLLSALLISAFWFPACATTEGHDRADATAMRVESVGGAAGQTQLHLDQTLNALDQITATAKQDPRPAFKQFTSSFDAFRSELADLATERSALERESSAWFTEFSQRNAAIQDPDLRAKGDKRLAELKEKTTATSKRFSDFLTKTSSFETRLADLRVFLGNDLTPDAIDSVSSRIKNTTKEGRELASDLGDLSKAAESLAEPLRAARNATPAAASK